MALVPYSQPKTLEKFHEDERSFEFSGQTLKIVQDWNEGGVAGVVWDAAVVLGKFLENHNSLVKNKKALELGAGTGLVGMVAALLGSDVLVTDREIALKYISKNIDNNSDVLANLPIKVAELTWGQNTSNFQGPFDLILGADIIYIEETFQDLFKTLMELSGKETIILLSCRIRYDRDDRFLELLNSKFHVEKAYYNKETDIVVYKAKKIYKNDIREDL